MGQGESIVDIDTNGYLGDFEVTDDEITELDIGGRPSGEVYHLHKLIRAAEDCISDIEVGLAEPTSHMVGMSLPMDDEGWVARGHTVGCC